MPEPAPIPLTVVGGFLGAGKTTLVNGILGQASGIRTAVLVNDFGAVNVDAALIEARDGETIALTNGCVCCSIGDDLTDALIRVMARSPAPDWIVIEASGVSDPWRIAQVGLADPALTLDGVVVLADATTVQEHAADARLADTIQRQLRAADLVVLNKRDLVAPQKLARTRAWLQLSAPGAAMVDAEHASIPAALLSGIAAGRMAARSENGHDHEHGSAFESLVLRCDGVMSASALRSFLDQMPRGVLRAKGLVRTDEAGAAVLQFSGKRGTLRAARQAAPTRSEVVIVGLRGELRADILRGAWRSAQR